MLFDLHPKDSTESLFGRNSEISDLLKHLENRRWVALLGTRMVGKTSLVKVVKDELRKKGVEALYINLWGITTISGLLDGLTYSINASPRLYKDVKQFLSRINGINIGSLGVSIKHQEKPVSQFWKILSVLGKHSKHLIIILDEVQELGLVTSHLTKLLANIFSTYPTITFCFTGSYFGLVKSLLEPNPESPLYGRNPVRFTIAPFNQNTARNFLLSGFQESKRSISADNIEEVITKFDGLPGWLTLYGNSITISNLTHQQALKYTEKQALKVQQQSLKHFLQGKNSHLYLNALKIIATNASWSDVKRGLKIRIGKDINDASIKNLLDKLQASFYIKKSASLYQIIDPTLRKFLLSGSRLLVNKT